ncbi:hypothetical protein B296_00018532 [Ensete ventricosum]|uniref:Uncharacterized protein n=1 Tax=Ensete ventricosum TaxID=4639 RepID=A0A426Z605_ENSVE|nr:hypothetical protein B296_00018532 [Ensete ventricosum]
MTNANLVSLHRRTVGLSAWLTRRRWPIDYTEDVSCRTADLAQITSAPPTCKRTPHCQDGKHGERRDGMAEGATACRPSKPSSESPLIRTSSHSVPEVVAHTGLDQQMLAQHA